MEFWVGCHQSLPHYFRPPDEPGIHPIRRPTAERISRYFYDKRAVNISNLMKSSPKQAVSTKNWCPLAVASRSVSNDPKRLRNRRPRHLENDAPEFGGRQRAYCSCGPQKTEMLCDRKYATPPPC